MNASRLSIVLSTLFLSGCAEMFFPFQGSSRRSNVEVASAPVPDPVSGDLKVLPPGLVRHPDELEYIRRRRVAAGIPADRGTEIGVALSGGGVRSANFNLGTLQGLEDMGLLKQVDYLSCVSGGGYIGGWYVSHLRTQRELDSLKSCQNWKSVEDQFSSSRTDLLNIRDDSGVPTASDAVGYVRKRSGLFGHGRTRAWTITRSSSHILATFVPNLIQDVGIHLHPAPGKWNVLHPIYQYRQLLKDTYLNGWEQVSENGPERPILESDVNSYGSETPFLISCGALANSRSGGIVDGRPEADVDGRPLKLMNNHHFEFTRFWCGSPLTGWVPTRYFDRTVADVNRRNDAVSAELLHSPLPFGSTAPFRLSSAMAASGAAIDAAGVSPNLRGLANNLLSVVNLNLRYQTSNFSQNLTEWYARPLDRARETTFDRGIRSPQSNVLQISDGGHFENLGIFALLRRNVETILGFDATCDPTYKYADLTTLLSLIESCGWRYEIAPGVNHNPGSNPVLPSQFPIGKTPDRPIWRFHVTKPDGKRLTVYYVKNSFRSDTDARDPMTLRSPWLYALDSANDSKGDLASRNFPHIGTAVLDGWTQQRFDAYRDLGRFLARKVSATLSHHTRN